MKKIFVLVFLISIFNIIKAKKSEEDSIFSSHASFSLPIEHSFGPDDSFASRGHIQFKTSTKVTTASFTTDAELSGDEVAKLQKLVEQDGLYMIRSPGKIGGIISDDKVEDSGTQYVSTFVRACYLYGSGLTEVIKISVDNSGNVIGLSVASPRHTCASANERELDNHTFNSTILVHQQVPGAIPDTQTYIKKLEQEKSDQAAGKGKDTRSFLSKYWMYILPLFLVLMLSSQAEPPAEGGE